MRGFHGRQGMQVNDGRKMRADEVVQQIERAFNGERYPGDNRLTQGSSMEAAEIRDFLRSRHWQDLRLDELVHSHASLFFMTPEAVRYFLPAFLIASVQHYDDSDQIPSTLLFFLNPYAMSDSAYQSRFRERFESFNNSERAAIRAFLEYLRDTHSADFPASSGKDQASEVLDWWAERG